MAIEDFEKKLLNMRDKADDELVEFIQKEFQEIEYQDRTLLRGNLETLKNLDSDLLAVAIARMDTMIEKFQAFSKLQYALVLILALITLYTDNLSFLGIAQIVTYIELLLTGLLFVWLAIVYLDYKKKMLSAVYFKNLLEHVKNSQSFISRN